MATASAATFGKQSRGPVLLETAQQTKHLTPLQANQYAGIRGRPDWTRSSTHPMNHRITCAAAKHGAQFQSPKSEGVAPRAGA